jgi:type IV pilus assembly protein PilC
VFAWWPPFTTTRQRKTLLRLLAVGIEEGLPLRPLVESWAADERGIQRRRLNRLVRLLAGGMSLPDAVEAIPGILRDEDVLAIRFDAQTGTRTAAVRQLLVDSDPSAADIAVRVRGTFAYLVAVLAVMVFIVTFLMISIVPQLENILQDFSVNEPKVLRWSISMAQWSIKYWYLGALSILAFAGLFYSSRAGRFIRHSLAGRLFFPLRELRAADVLHKLEVSTTAGRPIPSALSTLARYHFDPQTRRKLLFVRNELEQGADVWQSMNRAGLLTRPEARLLDTSERLGNRPWVLEQLAGVKSRRSTRLIDRLSQWILPAIVLVLGAFVLFQALSVFTTLTEVMNALQ